MNRGQPVPSADCDEWAADGAATCRRRRGGHASRRGDDRGGLHRRSPRALPPSTRRMPPSTGSVAASVVAARPARASPNGRWRSTSQAVHTSCDAFELQQRRRRSTAVNAYVDAYNTDAPDVDGQAAGPAIDALNKSADPVVGQPVRHVAAELHGRAQRLGRRRAAARRTPFADAAGRTNSTPRSAELNDTKTDALNLCDAAY